MIFFCVRYPNMNVKVFTMAFDREDAKRKAHAWIGLNPDKYIVMPLTQKDDRIKIEAIYV